MRIISSWWGAGHSLSDSDSGIKPTRRRRTRTRTRTAMLMMMMLEKILIYSNNKASYRKTTEQGIQTLTTSGMVA